MKLRREDIAIAILWLLLLVGLTWAAIYALNGVAETTSKIIVALIGTAGVLLGGILTHALTVIREQDMELRRQRQLNYAALLDKLAPFVRSPEEQIDELTKAYLYSWVVGSRPVVETLSRFVNTKKEEDLRSILSYMRRDLSLSEIDERVPMNILKPLPAKKEPGSLK